MTEVRETAAYADWFASLRDLQARARVLVRIRRLSLGNPGDVKPVGEGVSELRIDYGPGYRVYFVRRGDTVVIVSGSLDAYLRPWCASLGLDLICNRLESVDGRLTGRYLGGDRGPHKAADIRARHELASFDRVHAYGDSSEDRAMLALAHERWWRGVRVA